jgi:hypothetical protein
MRFEHDVAIDGAGVRVGSRPDEEVAGARTQLRSLEEIDILVDARHEHHDRSPSAASAASPRCCSVA